MKALTNALQWVSDNWSAIVILIGLAIAVGQKVKSYTKLTKQEKIDLALAGVKETILKTVSDAEIEWKEYSKAGSIKRAQVIADIYKKYPILAQVTDQETLLKTIDDWIDKALETVRTVIDTELEKSESKPEVTVTTRDVSSDAPVVKS